MKLSLRKTRKQVLRSPCHAHTNFPHDNQSESQRSFKPSDMPQVPVFVPHEKLQVLIDKVYIISMQL